jgi:hypothetical protein
MAGVGDCCFVTAGSTNRVFGVACICLTFWNRHSLYMQPRS